MFLSVVVWLSSCKDLSLLFYDRRVDSLNLEIPYHTYDPLQDVFGMAHETYIEGEELYLHFFHEQVRSAGFDRNVEEEFE